jgi:hypothetical protein
LFRADLTPFANPLADKSFICRLWALIGPRGSKYKFFHRSSVVKGARLYRNVFD